MIIKLLTEQHLEFLSLKGGCRGSSESTHVKMPDCWKSHALAHMLLDSGQTDEGRTFYDHKKLAPGHRAQSVMCLATDVSLTADPGVASSIPARSHMGLVSRKPVFGVSDKISLLSYRDQLEN